MIDNFNLIAKAVSSSEKRCDEYVKQRKRIYGRNSTIRLHGVELTFADTFQRLKIPIRRVRDQFAFLCHSTGCRDQINEVPLKWRVYEKPKGQVRLNSVTSPTHGRHKRQVMAGVAMSAVSMGLSVYNLYEVERLKNDVFTLSDNQRRIFSTLSQQSDSIEHNRKAVAAIVNKLNDEEKWLSTHEQRISLDEFYLYLTSYLDEMETWATDLTTLLFDKRPAPRFFPEDVIAQSVQELSRKAHHKGLDLAVTQFHDVIRQPMSFLIEEDVIYFMLHVSLVESEVMNLYYLMDTPIRAPSGLTVRLRERVRLMATDYDNSVYIPISDEDFAQCQRTQGRYVCLTGVASKNAASNCLSALFIHHSAAAEICDFFKSNETTETLTQTGYDEVIVTAPSATGETTVRVNCQGQGIATSREEVVRGAETVKVPPGCVLSSDSFSFAPTVYSGLHSDFALRPMPPPILNAVVERLSQSLHPAKEFRLPADAQLPNLPKLPHLKHVSAHAYLVESILTTITVILVSVLIVSTFVYACRKRRKAKKAEARRAMRLQMQGLGARAAAASADELDYSC